jgi:putative FmdB family regulatory protein
MPIFEFECCQCCERFEQLVFRSDEPVNCPKCESGDVQRVMSVFGFKSSGGEKGVASSRMGSGASSSCAGCSGGSCSTCH